MSKLPLKALLGLTLILLIWVVAVAVKLCPEFGPMTCVLEGAVCDTICAHAGIDIKSASSAAVVFNFTGAPHAQDCWSCGFTAACLQADDRGTQYSEIKPQGRQARKNACATCLSWHPGELPRSLVLRFPDLLINLGTYFCSYSRCDTKNKGHRWGASVALSEQVQQVNEGGD